MGLIKRAPSDILRFNRGEEFSVKKNIMRIICGLLILVCISWCGPVYAEKLNLSDSRIISEIGVGILGSISGWSVGVLFPNIASVYYPHSFWHRANTYRLTLTVFSALTTSTSVYLVGNTGQQTGSFLAALTCSSIATWLATSVLEPTKLAKLNGSWLVHAGSVAGAVIGFHLRRQSRKERTITKPAPPIQVKLLKMPFQT